MITTIIIQVFIPIILGSVIFLIGYLYGKKVERKFEIEKDEFYHSKHYKDFVKSWNDDREERHKKYVKILEEMRQNNIPGENSKVY